MTGLSTCGGVVTITGMSACWKGFDCYWVIYMRGGAVNVTDLSTWGGAVNIASFGKGFDCYKIVYICGEL